MVFSSTVFLFIFLPIVLFFNFILKNEAKNVLLLIASLFFYAWGEHILVLLMISSICINYVVGVSISYSHQHYKQSIAKLFLAIGLVANLSVLLYYKYIHFILENLSAIGLELNLDTAGVTLPIGVSFFTFQNISYLMDVYRKEVDSQKNLLHLGLYISLFPQLIAGPIVRYVDIAEKIKNRFVTSTDFAEGAVRFIRGLFKKVIIANSVGLIVDQTFALQTNEISTGLSWLAIICYALQIYFDFSGYSDMAIGLGRMLGFNFKENFNYPYIASSIKDFWRRWHISLSTWFRDYLYISLGGNRKGEVRTYVNLIIVFFITGLWHGASWNFVVWGLYHGMFLLIEKFIRIKLPSKFQFISHIYLLVVVLVGWVFFRAEDLPYAWAYLGRMFTLNSGNISSPFLYMNNYFIIVFVIGLVFATPLRKLIMKKYNALVSSASLRLSLRYVVYLLMFVFTMLELAQSTYNPFIYFRF